MAISVFAPSRKGNAMTDLPIAGAAMMIEDIAAHRDWLLEKPRDLEIQNFFKADVLESDWTPLVERARDLLDGHTGRLGIHGPFWGFTIDSQDPDVRAVVIKRFNQGLDACAALGADQMVIHSPYTTWDYNNLDNNEGAREQVLERCHLTLDGVVKRAGDIGVTLVIENIEDVDPHDRVRLAASFNSDAIASRSTPAMRSTLTVRPGRRRSTITSPLPAIACITSIFRTPMAMPIATGPWAKGPCAGRRSSPPSPGSPAIRG